MNNNDIYEFLIIQTMALLTKFLKELQGQNRQYIYKLLLVKPKYCIYSYMFLSP